MIVYFCVKIHDNFIIMALDFNEFIDMKMLTKK